ncbi:class I SAM-dependent methyltransferase [Tenacibaculum jejuense]|uniref:Methyltransferase FkbM domain-containing protein n=1 Tax=Tenacibaculum jejuense TaxID=584609 RepID=A0A238UER5_9FLAO|nr:hypothetical protein [Tenacibaculum jejuense]SNR17697.1 conserved protein of unknown function [Tenacibaculum jejuense]
MKSFLRRLLHLLGFNINYKVNNTRILKLIQSIQPVYVGLDLVRLGASKDSGYLLPNDFEGIEACFSPGCDNKFQFEEDCFKKEMAVFIADKTVKKENVPQKFNFIEKFINPISNDDLISMDKWVTNSIESKKSDLILQMDIEGDEYINFLNISDQLLKRFRIIVVEFHHLEQLSNPFFYTVASNVFSRLIENHTCVHIHPNNSSKIVTINGIKIPPLIEVTFLRNDRCKVRDKRTDFPHKLDADCVEGLKSVKLPQIWYK